MAHRRQLSGETFLSLHLPHHRVPDRGRHRLCAADRNNRKSSGRETLHVGPALHGLGPAEEVDASADLQPSGNGQTSSMFPSCEYSAANIFGTQTMELFSRRDEQKNRPRDKIYGCS